MRNSPKHITSLILSTMLSVIATPAFSAEMNPYANTLTGNWNGMRNKLSDTGVEVTVEYKADLWNVASGGIKNGSNYMDNLDVKVDLDGEKLFGIKGNTALISFLNNAGGKTNATRVGSAEGMDNIETGTNAFKLYEAWIEQSFYNDKLSVLIGLHDLNSEFDVTDMSGNFLKPTMQVNQSFAQSGQNGPSIFPNTSLAGRVRVSPVEDTYISAAAFDGVPGNPAHPRGTHIDINDNDGLLLIAEAGFTPKAADVEDSSPNKFAIGGWTYTKQMPDLVDVDSSGNPLGQRMMGAYLLSSYRFYHDSESGHDIGAFFRAGIADGDTAQVNWDYVAGIVGNGWVPNRPDSEIGLGFTRAHNGSKYIQSLGGIADGSENGMELYYRDVLMPGITLQPDLQYIVNPGSDTVAKDAFVLGIRLDITF